MLCETNGEAAPEVLIIGYHELNEEINLGVLLGGCHEEEASWLPKQFRVFQEAQKARDSQPALCADARYLSLEPMVIHSPRAAWANEREVYAASSSIPWTSL